MPCYIPTGAYKETGTLPGNDTDTGDCIWVKIDEDIRPFLERRKLKRDIKET